MNDIPEALEEPFLYSPSFFGLDIPLVSLGILHSAHPPVTGGERSQVDPLRYTEYPRWVHWSWYIPDHRKFPAPSKKDTDEGRRASCEYSKVMLHD